MALEDAGKEIDVAFTRAEPKGLAYENPFAGVPSFLRRKLTKDLANIDLAITGIPFDQAVTHRAGTRFGPRALRDASTMLAGDAPYGWGFSPLEEFAIADYGDMAFDYAKTSDVPALIEAHTANILAQGAGCLTLGGDHSITLPILRAHAAVHGPFALCQIDAHPDTWTDDDNARVDHGTFVYTALQEGLLDVERSVQIGTRVEVEGEKDFGIRRIDAPMLHDIGAAGAAARVKEILAAADRSILPLISTDWTQPMPQVQARLVWGGLTTAQAAVFLRNLAGINLIGADVVEVSPPYDHCKYYCACRCQCGLRIDHALGVE